MYLNYLFKEKLTGKVIYVGSSARPSARMKEHIASLKMKKPRSMNQNIYKYMRKMGFEFYKDVEVVWMDCSETKDDMLKKEEESYFKYFDTILNDRPGEITSGCYNPRRRNVICLNDGKTFKTVTECSEYYKKGRTTISNVLIKEKPYTYINNEKYYFEYVNKTCND